MKVLLVCHAAITTNVLAVRLQQVSKERGRTDSFTPCKLELADDIVGQHDAVLVAPQVKNQCGALRAACARVNVPLLVLDDDVFVHLDAEAIYGWLEEAEARARSLQAETRHVEFGPRELLAVVGYAVAWSLAICLIGAAAYLLCVLTGIGLLMAIYQCTVSVSGVYLAMLVGFDYGRRTGQPGLATAFVALASVLIMLPTAQGLFDVYGASSLEGLLFAGGFGIPYWPVVLVSSVVTVLVMEGYRRIAQVLDFKPSRYTMFSTMGRDIATVSVSFLVRAFMLVL